MWVSRPMKTWARTGRKCPNTTLNKNELSRTPLPSFPIIIIDLCSTQFCEQWLTSTDLGAPGLIRAFKRFSSAISQLTMRSTAKRMGYFCRTPQKMRLTDSLPEMQKKWSLKSLILGRWGIVQARMLGKNHLFKIKESRCPWPAPWDTLKN